MIIVIGEYGIVYKGYIINKDGESFDEYFAIKTLKGILESLIVLSGTLISRAVTILQDFTTILW